MQEITLRACDASTRIRKVMITNAAAVFVRICCRHNSEIADHINLMVKPIDRPHDPFWVNDSRI
jgi:hypothetical protein